MKVEVKYALAGVGAVVDDQPEVVADVLGARDVAGFQQQVSQQRPVGGFTAAFLLDEPLRILGVGAWLGTIMLFNVWALIWPNQKKVLGLCGVEASDEEKAKAKKIALMASRTNTLLSIPMLMCMVGSGMGHGLPL